MRSNDRRAWWQVANTTIPFALLWYLMYLSLDVSYWLTLALSVPTAGFLIRLFIFQHDCGHGSFFSSQRANNWLGRLVGVVMMTPYQYWRRTHAIHHATSGNLDRREFGEIKTLTVEEYEKLSPLGKFSYRFYRNIFTLLFIGPFYQFVIKHRYPFDIPRAWKREWKSVWGTNASILAIVVLSYFTIGVDKLLLVHLPILLCAGAMGMWLFYVQHQFEDTYWRDKQEWEFHDAGLQGSSFYDLPRILHWFTGNIGYHHIHHLASRIPNYHLRRAMEEVPDLNHVTRLSVWESIRCARYKLWDEAGRRLVGFRDLRKMHRRNA